MKAVYNKITRFLVEAKCIQPLHIGSGAGNAEILINESTGNPFIQGTSIAGVCSAYVEGCKGKEETEKYFGSKKDDSKSSIVFSEGTFCQGKMKIEMRTRVKMDGATSSAGKKEMKGGSGSSGQLMDVEYISAGSVFAFTVCAMDASAEIVKECLAAMHAGIITIGGKSTIGCGQVRLEKVVCREYDMTQEKDRKSWEGLALNDLSSLEHVSDGYCDILKELENANPKNPYYEIEAEVCLRTPMMIKANFVKRDVVERALCVKDVDKLPDNMPIVDGNNEFIIPGSSLKGVFRSRMETISKYVKLPSDALEKVFEDKSDCIFSDSFIRGSEEGKDDAISQVRIHINKLSGSVMDKHMLSEVTVAGNSTIKIKVPKQTGKEGLPANAVIGLILFVLRDMELGVVTLGSGASIGRGFVSVNEVRVKTEEGCYGIDFHDVENLNQEGFINDCIQAVKGGTV